MSHDNPEAVNPRDPRFRMSGKPVKPYGPLKAKKREDFAQARALNMEIADAYESAYGPQKSRQQASKSGWTLQSTDDVKARIYELSIDQGKPDPFKTIEEQEGVVTQEYINKEMMDLVVICKLNDEHKLAKDVLVIMGKEVGMYNDGKSNDVTKPTPAQLPNTGNGTTVLSKYTTVVQPDTVGAGSGDAARVDPPIDITRETKPVKHQYP